MQPFNEHRGFAADAAIERDARGAEKVAQLAILPIPPWLAAPVETSIRGLGRTGVARGRSEAMVFAYAACTGASSNGYMIQITGRRADSAMIPKVFDQA